MLTTCVYSGICGVASKSCTPDVATVENCGFIAAVAEKNKKKGCSMAFQCGCNTNGASSKCAQLECTHVNSELLAAKGSVAEIFLWQIRLHSGYYVDGPWYNAVKKLLPPAKLEQAESVAWTRYIAGKFIGRMM